MFLRVPNSTDCCMMKIPSAVEQVRITARRAQVVMTTTLRYVY